MIRTDEPEFGVRAAGGIPAAALALLACPPITDAPVVRNLTTRSSLAETGNALLALPVSLNSSSFRTPILIEGKQLTSRMLPTVTGRFSSIFAWEPRLLPGATSRSERPSSATSAAPWDPTSK